MKGIVEMIGPISREVFYRRRFDEYVTRWRRPELKLVKLYFDDNGDFERARCLCYVRVDLEPYCLKGEIPSWAVEVMPSTALTTEFVSHIEPVTFHIDDDIKPGASLNLKTTYYQRYYHVAVAFDMYQLPARYMSYEMREAIFEKSAKLAIKFLEDPDFNPEPFTVDSYF